MSGLSDAKVGDVLLVTSASMGIGSLTRVARVTKTQVVATSGARYKRATGWLVGGGTWCSTNAEVATPEQIATHGENVQRARALAQLRSVTRGQVDALPIERLNAIVAELLGASRMAAGGVA